MQTGTPITILLVEDDDAHAEIVRRNLGDARVANRMIRVSDGQQALDFLRHEGDYSGADAAPRPDLVLLDLRLPRVDGLEVLRRIKADEDLMRIPVVVLTTSRAEADTIGAYERGVNSYLVKPVDFESFRTLMQTFGFYWVACNLYPRQGPDAAKTPGHVREEPT